MTSFHTVQVELEKGCLAHTRVVCSAPAGSKCRDVGPASCQCETWYTNTDKDGSRWHWADDDGEGYEPDDFETNPSPLVRKARHDHHDGGECMEALWINESDVEECVIGTVTLSEPVELTWDGDGWMMKEVEA